LSALFIRIIDGSAKAVVWNLLVNLTALARRCTCHRWEENKGFVNLIARWLLPDFIIDRERGAWVQHYYNPS